MLFNKVTGNQFATYQSNNNLKLPEEMVVSYYVNDGLIKSVESSLEFTIKESMINITTSMIFSYDNNETLPDLVAKEVLVSNESSMILNGEVDFVKEISYANQGALPPDESIAFDGAIECGCGGRSFVVAPDG